MTNEELEARIRETGAVEDYAVYGDWLEERGDPRGKLIALQIAGLSFDDYVDEHAAMFGAPAGVDVTWKYGFWNTMRTRGMPIDLVSVLAHPSARLLEALRLDGDGTPSKHFHATLTRSSRIASPSTLETLGCFLRRDQDSRAWLPTLLHELRRLGLGCTELSIGGVYIDKPMGTSIAQLDGLRSLVLGASYPEGSLFIDRDALLALAPLADSLVSLHIIQCSNFDDESIPMLASFAHLEELHVPRTEIMAAGIQWIATLPKLRVLDVRGCPRVDDACGDVIGTFPAIETVAITGTPMGAWGVKGIACSRTIKKIILDHEQYPEEIESVLGIELADP